MDDAPKTVYLPEAREDMQRLDGSVRLYVRKALKKLETAPERYGKALGHKGGWNLTGLREIKLRDAGIRVIYQFRRAENELTVVVVGKRADSEAYKLADERVSR